MANTPLRWLVFAGALLFSAAVIFLAVTHGVAERWAGSANPDQWRRAADLEPSNPDNWYRLGRYRQLDFENNDLRLALSYYERATAIDPGSSRSWMDLGSAYEAAGNINAAEQAYRKAQQNYAISAAVSWAYGNFLMRQGRVPEAFAQIKRALDQDPSLAPLGISLCWRSAPDIDQLLNNALPAKPQVYWAAIQFFINTQEPGAAMEVWKHLTAGKPSFPASDAFPLLDFLIQSDHAEDAGMVWQQALSIGGIVPQKSADGSVVWDGGFEADLLNGGFGWRYKQVNGAKIGLDEETVHSGRRSLRVSFDGTANVVFSNVWQYVILQPNTRYQLRAYMQTQQLTTDTGMHFEITDLRHTVGQSTGNMIGTAPWAVGEAEFSTGPETQLALITLSRSASGMLANKIRGTAWIDDVSLRPIGEANTVKQ